MCEFHESICNGLGDIWWTDNPIYFSSIDDYEFCHKNQLNKNGGSVAIHAHKTLTFIMQTDMSMVIDDIMERIKFFW